MVLLNRVHTGLPVVGLWVAFSAETAEKALRLHYYPGRPAKDQFERSHLCSRLTETSLELGKITDKQTHLQIRRHEHQ